jgi:hypothetical protein
VNNGRRVSLTEGGNGRNVEQVRQCRDGAGPNLRACANLARQRRLEKTDSDLHMIQRPDRCIRTLVWMK